MATQEEINNWFGYHSPTGDQAERYNFLTKQFRQLAMDIVRNTPSCADQTAALRKLRETSMAVNQTIACNEEEPE
jgi:hypothetical protein